MDCTTFPLCKGSWICQRQRLRGCSYVIYQKGEQIMKKTFFLFFITMLLICSAFMNTSGAEFVGLSTNDLFIKYPYYLNNAETNEIFKEATDTYHAVMSDYDENDELISAIKSGVSTNVETTIRNFGSKLGLMDSYYEVCMDKATVDLMKTLYADENLIAALSVTEKASKTLDVVENMSDVSIINSDVIASLLYNLSADEVFDMTEVLSEKYGDVLDPLTDTADVAKYIYTACIITDVQIELVDTLMGRVDTSSQLYEGLGRLRQDMSYDIVGYTLKTFIENKALSDIAEAATGSGPMIIAQIIAKTAVWVMFDLIYPHPDADEVIANMIHSMYVMELDTALINQRLAFDLPFYVSDMEDYETVFTAYLAAVKTTLESTKALAKTASAKNSLDNAKTDLENALPNYEAYLTKCKNEVFFTPEEDRIIRPADQTMDTNGTTVIGNPGDLEDYEIIPITSDGMVYWALLSRYDLIINEDVTIPALAGSVEVNASVTVEGDFNNEGTLKMQQDEDYVLVKGNYIHHQTTSEYITAGTLEVKGNMQKCGGYAPTGTHKTILSGDSYQYAAMYYWPGYDRPYCYGSFNILEIKNTSVDGVDFAYGKVTKELYADDDVTSVTGRLRLVGNAKIRNNIWNHDITLNKWSASEKNIFGGVVYISENVNLDTEQVFNGNVNISGNVNLTAKQVFNGDVKTSAALVYINAEQVFNGNVEMWSDVYINVPTVFSKNLTLKGRLDINSSVICYGDFINDGSDGGMLKMEQDEDYVLVVGSYYHPTNKYHSSSEYITAGTLEIKGNMDGCGGYAPTGTHKTVLSGDEYQKVSLYYYYESTLSTQHYGHFNILEITNTSAEGVEFNYSKVLNELYADENSTIVGGENLDLTGSAKIRGNAWNSDITLNEWSASEKNIFGGVVYTSGNVNLDTEQVFNGNVNISGNVNLTAKQVFNSNLNITSGKVNISASQIFNGDVNAGGKLTINAEQIFGRNLSLLGEINLNADVTVKGNVLHRPRGILDINGYSLTCCGIYNNEGTLKMTRDRDYVLVKREYRQVNPTSQYITAGILEIQGNMNMCGGYTPTGTHKTILSGNAYQNINLRFNSYYGNFNILEIANTSTVVFGNRCEVTGDILQPVGTNLMSSDYVQLRGKPAFIDYGELNAEINAFNRNAENVIPTWLDFERYLEHKTGGDTVLIENKYLNDTSVDFDAYFSSNYEEETATAIIAFYDFDGALVQMQPCEISLVPGKNGISIPFDETEYSTYKIMIWNSLDNLVPLMKTA